MVHEDGTVKWVLELARPIHDEHGDPWVIQGVIFDITARKEAEELQAARSERLSSIIETQRDIAADRSGRRRGHADDLRAHPGAHPCRGCDHPHPRWRRSRDPRRHRASWTSKVGHRHPDRGDVAGLVLPTRPIGHPGRRADGSLERAPWSRSWGCARSSPSSSGIGDETIGQLIVFSRTAGRRSRGGSRNAGAPLGRRSRRHSATRPSSNRSASRSRRSLASRRSTRARPSASR